MNNWNKVYLENKKLDEIFFNKYFKTEPYYYEKNVLELIVEICEFANETKCFKYWSIKKPQLDILLEEYADSILMVLYFYNYYNIKDVKLKKIKMSDNIIIAFNEIIKLSTELMENGSQEIVENIFSYLIHISNLLNVDQEMIIEKCFMKIEKNKERLDSNY